MNNFFKRIMGAINNIATRPTKGTFFTLLLSICAAFSACTNEVENISLANGATLQLKVGVSQPASRTIIEGNALPNGAQIGVSVVDKTGTAYQQQNYNNVIYTATEESGKQKWNTTANVTLSGEEATLYAYYPYVTGTDITAIPINMDVTDQKDWMYATPATGLSDAKSSAEVRLNHALTDLRLTFFKESYSGAGEVTEFTIQSVGMATSGTLNAKTGDIILPTTPINTITRTMPFTLTDKTSATPIDVMLIPTNTEAPVTISVTVDGHTYSTTTATFALRKAKVYNYVMKLTSTGLEVSSVGLVDWNEVQLDDATFEPEQGQNGSQEAYVDWVKLTYNVENTSQPTQIFFSELYGNTFDIANVDKMVILENTSRASGEPQMVTPAYQYTFTTTGEHTVYVKFADMTQIPQYAFYGCESLTGVVIPNSVKTIENDAFCLCKGLKSINLGKEIKTIGQYAFYSCDKLTEVVIPESLETIGTAVFRYCKELACISVDINNSYFDSRNNCNAIMETETNRLVLGCKNTIIPQDCEIIGEYAFYYCSELMEVVIPNSVETIEEYAFTQCLGLTEVTLGSGVTTIAEAAFENCSKLEKISFNNSLQNIDRNGFSGCTKLKNITLPESVKIIGSGAFNQCYGLTSIAIPGSVTKIGDWAFGYCNGLTEVTIGSSVQTIGEQAFYMCSELASIKSLARTAPNIENYTFFGVKNNGVLYVPAGAAGYNVWLGTGNYYLGKYKWTKITITE